MILLAYFSCDFVCCHVMQINYCATATDPADVVGWLVVECIFANGCTDRIAPWYGGWMHPMFHCVMGSVG